MAELVCREFEEYAEALKGVDGRYLLTGQARQDWRLKILELPGLSLMQGRDGAGNLLQAACQPGTHSLFIPLDPGTGLSVNGVALEAGDAAWLVSADEFHMRARSENRWLAVMIDARAWPRAPSRSRAGRAPYLPTMRLVALIQRILGSGDLLAPGTPASGMVPGVLGDASVQVAMALERGSHGYRGRPARARAVVLRRALELIEARLGQGDVRLDDLSQATGVSSRTLQAVFQEQLGVSPHQFIINRRLHAIHAAIRDAGPDDTVSGICARFGVWDFGRLARAYRLRFGMTPSATLASRLNPPVRHRAS